MSLSIHNINFLNGNLANLITYLFAEVRWIITPAMIPHVQNKRETITREVTEAMMIIRRKSDEPSTTA